MAGGAEVGTGHISIFPVMNGFRSAVNKEMKAAGKTGSNTFGKAFGTGKKIGNSFGTSFKNGFKGAGGKALADDILKPFKRDVAQASSKASAALLNYKQSTVAVTAAQERLNAAVAKYGADSTQAQAAAIKVEQAQLRQSIALDKSNQAAQKLADAKQALRAAESELAMNAGKTTASFKTMASSFAAGFSSISRGQSSFTGLSGALGGLVNSLLGVDAIWKPLGAKIGGFASTAVSKLSGFAVQAGAKIQTGLKSAIDAAQQTLKGWGSGIAATVSNIAKPIGSAISTWTAPIRDWGSRTGNTIKTAVTTWTEPIRSFGGKIGSAIGNVAGTVGQKLAPVANVAKNYFGNIATAASAVWAKLPAGAQSAAGTIGSTLGNLASSAGNAFKNLASEAGSHLKSLATGAVAAVGAGITAIGATVLATGKQALAAYASWEQAVGGVDTLFKDASGTVQKYASEAYKTAGLGANDYMNQVTSFAASLVSSLGGDTAKAAEMGNQAIIDMSDNANKMGTDIGSIQQTYQSLARGNYAMLDNLKLGYGGTKTEMQRLISDANKLPGVLKDGNDLSVDSFSDVVEAISRVQKQMGISGTTAREAATTIEGSVNSMKAAWQNWLAGLGNSNADMSALSQQLSESIGTALKNILPRVGQIAKGVVAAIPSLFGDLVTLLPKPFQTAINAVTDVFSGLGKMVAPVKNAMAPLLAAFMALGAGGIAPLLSKIPLLGGVLGGLQGPLAALGGPIGIVVAALGTLIATVPELRNAFGTQITGAFNLFKNTIAGMKPTFDAFGKSLQDMFNQVMPVITASVAALIPVFGDILQSLAPLIPTIIEPLMNALSSLMPVIGQIVTSLLPPLTDVITALLPPAQQIIAMITQIAGQVLEALMPAIQQIIGFIGQLAAIIGPIIEQLVPVISQAVEGIVAILQQLMPIIQGIIAVVSGVINAIVGFINGTLLPAVQAMLPYVSGVIDGISGVIQAVVGIVSGVINMVSSIIHGDWQGAWDAFKSILSSAASGVGSALNGIISAIKGVFAGAGSLLKSAGQAIVQGLIDGITGMISSAGSAIKSVMDTISSFIPHSPAKRGPFSGRGWTPHRGRALVEGLIEGMDDAGPDATKSIRNVMTGISGAMHANGQIDATTATGTTALAATGTGSLTDLITEIQGLRSDLQAFHDDIGPIIAQYAPTMTIRETKRMLGIVQGGTR